MVTLINTDNHENIWKCTSRVIVFSNTDDVKEKLISRKIWSSVSDNNFIIRCFKVWYSIWNRRSNEFWDMKSWSNSWYCRILTQKENWKSHYISAQLRIIHPSLCRLTFWIDGGFYSQRYGHPDIAIWMRFCIGGFISSSRNLPVLPLESVVSIYTTTIFQTTKSLCYLSSDFFPREKCSRFLYQFGETLRIQ